MKTPFKMKGFSGFGNSPLHSGVGSKNKSDRKSFDIDHDEIKKDGSNNYSDPTDPKSPTYNPNHGGSDFVKPGGKSAKKYTSDNEEQAYENAQNDYDTDNPTKAQLAEALRKVKAGK